jgi:flagellar motility protein MotE (MotC chaperone)
MVPNINGPYITFMDHCACSGTDEAHTELLAQRDALLEALRDLADTNNDFSEALNRARLAIARATTGTTEKP